MLTNANLISDAKNLTASVKQSAIRSVDFQRTVLYWHIGERVFNEKQEGKDRANYGKYLKKYLSEKLQTEFVSGFSYRQLELIRQFYRTFPIVKTLRSQLNWTRYKTVLEISNRDKRDYYIAETVKNNWWVRPFIKMKNFKNDL